MLDTRYRALVANLPDTIVTMFDPDLRIVVAEGAQLAARGLDAADYTGVPLVETLPPEQYAVIAPRYRAALAGEPQTFEVETPDGEVTYRVQVVPLHDAEGRLLGGLSVSRDVTEAVESRLLMAARAAELERSNAELAQFAYVASHASPSRCGWSPATCNCCAAATTARSTPTPTPSSTTRSMARRACGR